MTVKSAGWSLGSLIAILVLVAVLALMAKLPLTLAVLIAAVALARLC